MILRRRKKHTKNSLHQRLTTHKKYLSKRMIVFTFKSHYTISLFELGVSILYRLFMSVCSTEYFVICVFCCQFQMYFGALHIYMILTSRCVRQDTKTSAYSIQTHISWYCRDFFISVLNHSIWQMFPCVRFYWLNAVESSNLSQ